MQDLSEGGIFGALWEMADGAGIGLDVALKRIPIQQETVEICEFFGVNPYQMLSTGALLIAAADGEGLVQKMALEGIPSAGRRGFSGTGKRSGIWISRRWMRCTGLADKA